MNIKNLLYASLVVSVSACLTACSDNDEPTVNDLSGSSWLVISTPNSYDLPVFSTIQFGNDGNCYFEPKNDWTYAKWSVANESLKIVLGEGEPDDYVKGEFKVSGQVAKYTYTWHDCNGEWDGDKSYELTLAKPGYEVNPGINEVSQQQITIETIVDEEPIVKNYAEISFRVKSIYPPSVTINYGIGASEEGWTARDKTISVEPTDIVDMKSGNQPYLWYYFKTLIPIPEPTEEFEARNICYTIDASNTKGSNETMPRRCEINW